MKSVNALIHWSQSRFSHLPWRQNRTLYTTLVSEIMLQQTTVGTVYHRFSDFIRKFPSIEQLAKSSEEEVRRAWKGLGYYRRAKNLWLACQHFHSHYDSNIPLEKKALLATPGIGEYTASALLAIGADSVALAVDANLERVLARVWGQEKTKPEMKKWLAQNQQMIVKSFAPWSPRHFHEAIMDLGREVCRANKALCECCPLRSDCLSFQRGRPLATPVAEKKRLQSIEQLDLARFVCTEGGKILAYKKQRGEWLEGQLEIPTFILSAQEKLKQYPRANEKLKRFIQSRTKHTVKSAITKYKVINYVVEIAPNEWEEVLKLCEGSELSRARFYPTTDLPDLGVVSEKVIKKVEGPL